MHPAFSVIFFTTLSGAGYGLLFVLAIIYAQAPLSLSREFALLPFVIGLGLVSVGLLSSMLHLGQKKRAWRAFSQWRTSWLSREGVLAVLTYIPALGLMACIWQARFDVLAQILAIALAVLSLATVWCTARIYSSLKTIAAWHHPLVGANYLLLALITGLAWFFAVISLTGLRATPSQLWLAGLLILAAALLKWRYWHSIDNTPAQQTMGSMIGLAHLGEVRSFESPHTQTNFLLQEMGYRLARKHAQRLRGIATLLIFGVSLLAIASGLYRPNLQAIWAWPVLFCMMLGVCVERWLFFAQARHVVSLYYQPD